MENFSILIDFKNNYLLMWLGCGWMIITWILIVQKLNPIQIQLFL